jgi:ABC-type multidrug transport system ATPase subunit
VRYGRRPPVLQSIDFTVQAGEIVAFLGPNGSGKSTLLRSLAGDLPVASGIVNRASAAIGFASDEAVHVDALSTRTNALAFARACGLQQAENVVDRLVAEFGLNEWSERPAGELSFGSRRKLLLIEALAHSPSLLFLDEPTLGLDPMATRMLATLLRATAADGGAVLMATNDIAFAQNLTTRVVFLHAGRIVADDAPASLLDALHGVTRIEVDVAGTPPSVSFGDAITHTARVDGYTLQTRAGSAALPEICAALTGAGAEITGIRILRSDLADAFRALTGEVWQPVSRAEPQ